MVECVNKCENACTKKYMYEKIIIDSTTMTFFYTLLNNSSRKFTHYRHVCLQTAVEYLCIRAQTDIFKMAEVFIDKKKIHKLLFIFLSMKLAYERRNYKLRADEHNIKKNNFCLPIFHSSLSLQTSRQGCKRMHLDYLIKHFPYFLTQSVNICAISP